MNRIYQAQCCIFDCLLSFQRDDLLAQYGDEIRLIFQEELSNAWQHGATAILKVWSEILSETIALTTPRYAARLRLLLAATVLATGITVGSALGFCTLGPSSTVHACSGADFSPQASIGSTASGDLVQLPDGHRIFLECSGDPNAKPTVVLANGRGLGTADSWAAVQQRVPPAIRVCSYDAIGAGRSDHIQNDSHAERRPIDQVVSDMHALFQAGHLKQPYVFVGASDGGILIRHYQQEYSHEVAGLVFVDSAHEEQEWRMAAISKELGPNWNNSEFLRKNGFLPDHQKLAWHADIPLIVLERTEKAPPSAFPTLTQQQVDALNAEWHDHQVDLAGRSKYGQLRSVAGSGHAMHRQKPDAIADAIKDVVGQIRSRSH